MTPTASPWSPFKGTCRSPTGPYGVGLAIKRVLSYRGAKLEATIQEAPLYDGDLLTADADGLAPHKPCTDVLVNGTVVAPLGARSGSGSLSIAGVRKQVRVFGERRIRADDRGIRFEEVEPLREAKLSFVNAYGGTLPLERKRRRGFGATDDEAPPFDPRNPVGRGFVLGDRVALLDGALAPSQEDPSDPIKPERVIRKVQEDDWDRGPAPASFGPIDWSWQPRVDHLLRERQGPDPKVLSCAPPGLAFPHLEGRVEAQLTGFRWGRGEVRLGLDLRAPRARLDFPGAGAFEVRCHLATLLFDTDEESVTEVWGGFQPTAMPYPEDQLQDVKLTLL